MGKPLFARVLGLVWIIVGIAAFMGQSYAQYVGLGFFAIFGAPLIVVAAGIGIGFFLLWGASRIYWITVLTLVLSLAVVALMLNYIGAGITLILLVWMLAIRKKFGKSEWG